VRRELSRTEGLVVARSLLLYLRCRNYSPLSRKRKYNTAIQFLLPRLRIPSDITVTPTTKRSGARHACCLRLSRARHDKTRHPATLTGRAPRSPPYPPPLFTSLPRSYFPPLPCTSQPYCNPLLPYPFTNTTVLRSLVPPIHLHPRKQPTFAIASQYSKPAINHRNTATTQHRTRAVATNA